MEIVRSAYEHTMGTGEVHAQVLARDFVWDMSNYSGWPEQQLYEGVDGAQGFLDDWGGAWDEWEFEIEEIHDAGDKVVVVARQRGRARRTGIPLDMVFAQIWTVRDGRLTRADMYSDPAEALKAAGLEGRR